MKQSNQPICPKCAAIIPDEAPAGLCPKCALEGAATVSKPISGGGNPPPSIAEIAPHFPELEILELIGAGGMGAVYKARQPQLDRFVALKILSHHLAERPAFAERFNREARVLARLSHPNIVGVHDFGTGRALLLPADGVRRWREPAPGDAGRTFHPAEALAIVPQICEALQVSPTRKASCTATSSRRISSRSKGRVKIADFGIAKLVGEDRGTTSP